MPETAPYFDILVRLVAPYHAVLVHFPVALWTTVPLLVVFRALSDGALARAGDKVLVPLLLLSIVAGLAAYAVGFLAFPLDAVAASPLTRNHILGASWSIAYWTVILVTRWIHGETVWEGTNRWVMVGLMALGTLLITVTGTLGGHIAGNPTTVSQILHALGWDVYHTFFVPDAMLWVIVASIVVLPLLGWWGRRQPA